MPRLAIVLISSAACVATAAAAMQHIGPTYLPGTADAKIVTATAQVSAAAGVTVLTQALAIKESGPKETVGRFGEVYAFTPSFIVVHRDEPTAITFWNLQADDDHDFMLADARGHVLMHQLLPALQETVFVFTFHQEGLLTFYCTMHQPAMSGQILVIAPAR